MITCLSLFKPFLLYDDHYNYMNREVFVSFNVEELERFQSISKKRVHGNTCFRKICGSSWYNYRERIKGSVYSTRN